MKVGPPGPNRKRIKLDPNRPIVIDSSSSDDEDDEVSLSSGDEDGYEIGPDGHVIFLDESSDDDIEIIEEKSTPVIAQNEPGPSSRRESSFESESKEVETEDFGIDEDTEDIEDFEEEPIKEVSCFMDQLNESFLKRITILMDQSRNGQFLKYQF